MALRSFNKLTLLFLGGIFVISAWLSHGKPRKFEHYKSFSRIFQDTTALDSAQLAEDSLNNAPYSPSRQPTYQQKDRFGDPFSNNQSSSPLLLNDPSSLKLDVEIDTGMNYTIYEKIGDLNYRPTSSMTFEEFKLYQDRQQLKEYWKNRSAGLDGESAVSGRNLIPPIYISPVFDRIFGGSYVEIIPRGFVTLDFGGQWQRVDNPAYSIRQQRNGGFQFDQQISMNLVGKIGEKLQVTANFDNNNSFDFENNLKVEYTGFEEDILQKLEIGNVSLPLNNSLISGAQNLFGVKAQMQFGKLWVTTVASTQRGKTESIEIDAGGGQAREFQIQASDYDENRHFFLGHFFRDRYDEQLKNIPLLTTGINVTRVEVYVVNRNNDTETLRNIVGLMDLGEPNADNVFNTALQATVSGSVNANDANDLFDAVESLTSRDADEITGTLESGLSGIGALQNGTEFEVIRGARKLDESEFTFDRYLGYITLSRKLQNDEALAVAYEYTFNGVAYKVGELSDDYGPRPEEEAIFMKLLRPRSIRITDESEPGVEREVPSWDLMMKNIYTLSSSQVEKEGFELRVIYRDDQTGIDNPALIEGARTANEQLIELLGLDQLNPNGDRPADGNFDFVEGITINPDLGLIIFPTLEPFGETMESYFDETNETDLIEKYVFDELYTSTKNDAQQLTAKDKYFLTGRVQSGSSSEILLSGFNVAEGSVRVFAGGVALQEGVDYQVDYNFGKVTIINDGILNSGKKISITYETADLFNFQSRSLLGSRFEYRHSEDVNFGATVLYMNERPLITRNSVGNDPARNLKYGFDVNINKESRLLTKMVDALPIIQTKEPSNINFSAEFAQLIPGTSNRVDGEGTSYVDDFESTITPFNLGTPNNWKLATTPQTATNEFTGGAGVDDLTFGHRRAKISWYSVDNIFYRDTGSDLPELPDDHLENHYVRGIVPQEVFPNQDPNVINTNLPTFDIAYFPEERGPYNYNPDLTTDGKLEGDPRRNWGGITNAIRTEVDFDKANIEYIEFWLMDPFINSTNNKPSNSPNGVVQDGEGNDTGGDLVFNLGTISEDLIRDGRHGFENGLSADGSADGVTETEWGRVTTQQYLTNAFDNSEGARDNQDVGMDGLRNEDEVRFQDQYSASIWDAIVEDPSADNFRYFLNDAYDEEQATIIERYKDFNNQENNSPISSGTDIPESSSTLPDNEDLNTDNTLNELEEYYEYRVSLRPGIKVGDPYVADKVTTLINGDEVSWFLYRIPIRQSPEAYGGISGFKSMRYLRTYLTNFSEPVVLRMNNFRLVGSQWRREESDLEDDGVNQSEETDLFNLELSVVNIEENGQGNETQPPYVLPPGINRDRDNTSQVERQLNEQSLQLCVDDLAQGDSRAAFKNVVLDLINYGRIKMFLHADGDAEDGEVYAFLRLGRDNDHYYEIEVPLILTEPNTTDAELIWPEDNEIDIEIGELLGLKAARNNDGYDPALVYPSSDRDTAFVGNQRIRVKGNPDISDIGRLTIGIRNPTTSGATPSVCIWANELRVTDFDRTSGWAANASLNAKLADLANISASTRYTSFGFGSVQSKIGERTREETLSYDVSANVNLDKFLPEKLGLKVPMFVSYERETITPEWDPANPDIKLEDALRAFETEEEKQNYRDIVTDETTRRSLNFTNVRKVKTNPEAKNHIYDIENLSFTYAYSEIYRTNFNRALDLTQNYKGAVDYNYSANKEPWEPFKESKLFKSPYLKLIKDFNFNPLPSNLSVRFDLDRSFSKTIYRNEDLNTTGVAPNYEKYFTLNRTYNLRWDIAKSLSLDYNARVSAIIDEPEGDINSEEKRDSIWFNLKNLGRMKTFNQDVNANYRLPLDKFPITDWVSADYRYGVGYTWTAGSFEQADTLGNIIENNRDQAISGKFDLVKLYNKVKFLKEINSPPRRRRTSVRPTRTNSNDSTKTKEESEQKFAKGLLRTLMALRSVSVTYSQNEGTLLPGFRPRAFLFGMDSSFNAPGVPFLLGSQDPDIRYEAAEKGWIVNTPSLSNPFSQSKSVDLNIRATVEPFKDFKIQVDVKKRKSSQYSELFRYDTISNEFVSLSPIRNGNYSVSISTLRTAFKGDDDNNNSPVFGDFENYRGTVRNRLLALTGNEYDSSAQDVLIPSFIAAYTGKDPNSISLSPFPETPIPNWRLDYSGLSKIPKLKEIFSSVSITHSYQSSYSVNNYTNSSAYGADTVNFSDGIETYNETQFSGVDEDGNVTPIYIIDQVTISEQFSPLIGINVRTKSKMNFKVEYKMKRDLALQISNRQITEMNTEEVAMEVGFTKSKFKLPFKSQGRVITLKNDLRFRMSLSVKDTKTVQRKIDEVNTVTNGSINFQLRPNIDYVLNEKLNLQVYFERTINEPRISSSFKTSSTAFGARLTFSLAQ